jgi:hypothetical protein
MERLLTLEEVRRFCHARPVELSLAPSERAGTIVLHGDYEGYGDFFNLCAENVAFAQLAGRFWVSGFVLTSWAQLCDQAIEWTPFRGEFAGEALGMWKSEAGSLAGAAATDRFVVVAQRFVFSAGSDWKCESP